MSCRQWWMSAGRKAEAMKGHKQLNWEEGELVREVKRKKAEDKTIILIRNTRNVYDNLLFSGSSLKRG